MKKLILVAVFTTSFFSLQTYAQCPGGPDPICAGTNGPCGSFHDGTAGQFYSDTMSFYAPNQVDAGSPFGMVDFVQFQLANVTGLPAGLTWSCGNGSCVYNPQPGGILTNFNICGTPLIPGNYTIHVHIIGTVNIPGLGWQNGDQYYDLPLNIVAVSGGNSVFSFTPSQGCDSATVTFTPLMNFPLPQLTGYNWDFNGSVSSVSTTTPIVIDYNTTGVYPVTCTTNVYNMFLSYLNVNVAGTSWWCGDVEESSCGAGNADIIPTFTSGVSNWVGAEIDDNPTPNWNGIGFTLVSTSFSVSLMEYDPVSANDYPAGPITGTITAPGVYSFNYPGNFSVDFFIDLALAGTFVATDTVFVYASPPMDTIVASSTSFCPYDSVTLSVDPGYYYEWYLNDTSLVQSGLNNTYTTNVDGDYTVIVYDPVSGCSTPTGPLTLSASAIVPPGFASVGITETPPGTYHSILPGGYTYLWLYFDGINYFPIPTATTGDYTPSVDGIYCLIATNAAGCTDTSNCIGYHLGMENMATPFMANVYPNPTDGLINVNMSNLTEDASLIVHDMIGQQVYNANIPMGSTTEMHDLSFLTKGMYILEIRNKQSRYTQKIIIK